jgi:hypothetical protein
MLICMCVCVCMCVGRLCDVSLGLRGWTRGGVSLWCKYGVFDRLLDI